IIEEILPRPTLAFIATTNSCSKSPACGATMVAPRILSEPFAVKNFRETGIFALNHCTIDVFERNDEQVVIDIFLFRFLFGQSDMRDFWIDIRAPRHDRIIHFLPQKLEWNKNVSHNYARLRIGHVCKQEWPDYIAYTVNMPLRRL